MHKNHFSLLKYVLIICFLLSACAPEETITALATSTLAPILTKTPLPASTEIPTQTPPALPNKFEFPSWLANSNNQVFAMVTDVLENSNELTFVDANTHNKFVTNVPNADISRYFWTPDGKSLGFINSDFMSAYLINLITGEVIETNFSREASECLDEYEKVKLPVIRYIRVKSLSSSDPSFFCSKPRFDFSQVEKDGKQIIVLENLTTGQKTELSGTSEIGVSYVYELSPSQTKVAILQGTSPDPDLIYPMGTRISVYSLPDGKIIASYEGQFCSMKWSPDENKILTTQTDDTACYSNAVPTILYPSSSRSERISAIEDAQHSKYSISTFNWSHDSNFIYYTYVNPDRSDVCRYDLTSKSIFCPTSGFDELNKYNVEYYKLSPDEKFLALLYGDSCAGCDEWGEPSSALMKIDGSDLFMLGKEIYRAEVNARYPYNTLVWRPLINP